MSFFIHDIRRAFRLLQRQPAFAIAALLCLTLGIGANTAIFSLLNGILLKPMPYSEPDRLVAVANGSDGGELGWAPISYSDIQVWRERQTALQGIAGYRNAAITLQEGDLPERLTGMGVTDGLFETLGVSPALGRTFSSREVEAGGEPVALLTWGLWQRRFGGDPEILGREVKLNGNPHTVVGVMPEGFEFPWWSDIYLPLQADAVRNNPDTRNLRAVARLAEGVTLEGARAVMEGVQRSIRAEEQQGQDGPGVYMRLYQDQERAQNRKGLIFLMVGVGLLLFIACVNVANILLARASGRGREMAIRASLGASRGTVVRHLLAESLVLGGLGGILGMGLGVMGRDLLIGLAPMAMPFWMDFGLDGRVVAFTLGATLSTSLLFGLAPALFATRAHPVDHLRSGGDRNVSGNGRWGLRLVTGEVALALALLVSAGAMVRGLHSLLQVDPGFEPRGVLTFQLSLSPADYGESDERRALFEQMGESLGGLPGVQWVGAVQSMPLSGDYWGQGYTVEGQTYPDDQRPPVGNLRIVSGDYFRAAGISLKAGRAFSAEEMAGGSRSIVVNASLARRHWPDQNPLGRRLKLGHAESEGPWWTVVGVAADVRQSGLGGEEAQPGFYIPFAFAPQYSMTILLRTAGEPTLLAGPGRRVLSVLAPTAPVFGVRPLQDFYDDATGMTRFYSYLMSAFALAALALTLLGVAGVMAFIVRGKVREMGIRLALGASPSMALRGMVLKGVKPVVLGIFAGAGLGYLLLRALTASFYGVRAWDPSIYGIMGLTLLLTGFIAVWAPSKHVVRMDPAEVLSEE